MKIFTPDKSVPEIKGPRIFLAGPTPRSPDVKSWRPEALRILADLKFDGNVFVPERSDWTVQFDYYDQVEWEYDSLSLATIIAFWIPRELKSMPAFTTNVEFGLYIRQKPVVYGRPEGAPNTRYLDWLYRKMTLRDALPNLEATLQYATRFCEEI